MDGDARKAAVTAYKERKIQGGIYAVHCKSSGEVWVGHWPDISTIQTRLWFSLRTGTFPQRDLLAAWKNHGEEQFRFEVLETVEDEELPYVREANLKALAARWREKLNAGRI